jgi:hypothetical protein
MTTTDLIYVRKLKVDAQAIRIGGVTVVHVHEGLTRDVRNTAARQLLRVVHSVGQECASAHLPAGAAIELPTQRGAWVVKRSAGRSSEPRYAPAPQDPSP